MTLPQDEGFWAPRRCLREPIPEIFHAAFLLDRAVGAHLAGDHAAADALILSTNTPEIRAWTESLWGSKAAKPDQWTYLRVREVAEAPPRLPKVEQIRTRMPNRAERRGIVARYGRNCLFCGIPLISVEVRTAMRLAYPEALPWGKTNPSQHAAFQCMWMQFDHVLPHARGGGDATENIIVTCAPCNFGRGDMTLAEAGLIDPRDLPVHKTS